MVLKIIARGFYVWTNISKRLLKAMIIKQAMMGRGRHLLARYFTILEPCNMFLSTVLWIAKGHKARN